MDLLLEAGVLQVGMLVSMAEDTPQLEWDSSAFVLKPRCGKKWEEKSSCDHLLQRRQP